MVSERQVSCDHYVEMIRHHVESQQNGCDAVRRWLEAVVNTEVRSDWEGHAIPGGVASAHMFFGSRTYGLALPNSDVDIVFVFPNNLHSVGLSKKTVLKRALVRIRASQHCTSVNNAIRSKNTITFRSACLRVDFTVHVGDPAAHSPLALSRLVREELNKLPPGLRTLCLLTIEWAKTSGVCYNRKGPVSNLLKAVHWLLLALAFTVSGEVSAKDCKAETCHPSDKLRELLLFYSKFPFEYRSIDVGMGSVGSVFKSRSTDQAIPLWLSDPLQSSRNLAQYVDSSSLARIREACSRGASMVEIASYWHEKISLLQKKQETLTPFWEWNLFFAGYGQDSGITPYFESVIGFKNINYRQG